MKNFDKWRAEQLVKLCKQSVESRVEKDGNEWIYHYEHPERTVKRAVETFNLILTECHAKPIEKIILCVCGHTLAAHYTNEDTPIGCGYCGPEVCKKFREPLPEKVP